MCWFEHFSIAIAPAHLDRRSLEHLAPPFRDIKYFHLISMISFHKIDFDIETLNRFRVPLDKLLTLADFGFQEVLLKLEQTSSILLSRSSNGISSRKMWFSFDWNHFIVIVGTT